MNFVEMMTEKDSYTKNGAVTNSTSHNFCVDLFFLAGACRNEDVKAIENVITKAYAQDRLKTLKIIFWASDIRQGAGERRFFKVALNWLNKNHPEDIQNNISLIPEFSRWDVIFDLANENQLVFSYILSVLTNPEHPQRALLCKWLPRKSKVTDKSKETKKRGNVETTTVTRKSRILYNGLASKLIKALKVTPKEYRKALVEGCKTVEQQMCSKKWNEIEYSKVPSVAINKYNKAWYRNDEKRFTKYIEDVKAGKSKINASAIFPHDIIKDALYTTGWSMSIKGLNDAQIAQWNALPNWLGDSVNSLIPVCDTSGSMYGLPIQICLALGLYISERNQGPFKDAFITFSQNPKMQILKGDINQRLSQLVHAEWGQNTNLTGVFELILRKAKEVNLSEEMMPKTILVISDMEFDCCGNLTNYEMIKKAYNVSGYQCPQIAFWNVNGRAGNVPVTVNKQGVALVSGASPSVIKAVLTNQLNPVNIMDSIIETERYSVIQ